MTGSVDRKLLRETSRVEGFFLLLFIFIGVWLLYNVELVSTLQQNESAIYVSSFWLVLLLNYSVLSGGGKKRKTKPDLTSKTLICSQFWPGNYSWSGFISYDLLGDVFIFHLVFLFLYILSRRLAEVT